MKRKTIKEIRFEEYIGGFYMCLGLFEDAFRKEAWSTYHKRRAAGLSTLIEDTSKLPLFENFLFDIIQEAQEKLKPKDDEYRKIREDRINE